MSTKNSKRFEIVMSAKNRSGESSGSKRFFSSDSSEDFAAFFERNNGYFWDDKDPAGPFLMSDMPSTPRGSKGGKKQNTNNTTRDILTKKINKIKKSNSFRMKDGDKVVTDTTIKVSNDIINCIADLIRTKIRVLTNRDGSIQLEFNAYTEDSEQALEIAILNDEIKYNFWNGTTTDQEYSDYVPLDRKTIRNLVTKFNSGLKR